MLGPGLADAQERVHGIESTGGRLVSFDDGVRLLTVTGVGSALGRSTDPQTGVVHTGGWVSRDPMLAGPDALRISNVRVEAVTPDSAVIMFESSHDAEVVIEYGPTPDYRWEVSSDRVQALRMTNLAGGQLYHWKLRITDRDGRRRSTRDLTLCTPDLSEITPGLLEAKYYRGRNFDELVATRVEAGVDQPAHSDNDRDGDFGTGAGPDNFSARYTGIIRLDVEGLHYWRTLQDDGSRTYVDGILVVDAWQEARSRFVHGAASQLDAGWHALNIEYFNGVGPATIQADLRLPGGRLTRLPTDRLAHVNEDFYRPTIVPRDVPLEFECTSPSGFRRRLIPPEAFDCHDSAPRVYSDAPNALPLGSSRVVWTAENSLGKRSFWAEEVEVVDTRPPILASPAPVRVEAIAAQGTVVPMPVPSSSDRCDPELEFAYYRCDNNGAACQACWTEADEDAEPSHGAGGRNPDCACERLPGRLGIGTVDVTVIGTDDYGNCGSARFDVTVQDTTPPIIVVREVEFVCREAPIPQAVLRDNGTLPDDIDVTCSIDGAAPQSCDGAMNLANGDHTIRYVATDAAGLTSTATLEFNVGDDDPVPPTAVLQSATSGYTNGSASVTIRVRDNCDFAPVVVFNPAGETSQDGDDHTVTYVAEGTYAVEVRATDNVGNVSLFTVPEFGIDQTAPELRFGGLDPVADAADVLTWPVHFPQGSVGFKAGAQDRAGPANSGISQVLAVLTHIESGDSRVLLDHRSGLAGVPAAGPTRLKNLPCDEVVPRGEDAYCDAEGDLLMAQLAPGDYELVLTAHDQAGNNASTARHFVLMNWSIALDRTLEVVARALDRDDVPDLSRLFLEYIEEIGDEASAAINDPELLGNALLNTSSIIDSLELAESQGVNTGSARQWLNQGALNAVRRRQTDVRDLVAADDIDFVAGGDHLDSAAEELAAETHQASLLSLLNAFFRFVHAETPFIVDSKDQAVLAAATLSRQFDAYRLIEHAGGQEVMTEVVNQQNEIVNRNLFNRALDNASQALANIAFLDLLVRLNELSALLRTAQDEERVWVRNWQWPVALQVRTMSGAALELTALALGDDFEDPQDPLLAYTKSVFDEGVDLIADRLVDDALVVYVDARCLIFEVYNHGNFIPAGIPPEGWGCEECVLTGDCEHD